MLFRGHMLLVILPVNKLLERFIKKNCKNTSQKEFRVEKVINRKGEKLYVKWKDCDNSSKIMLMSEYFPKPIPLGGNAKIKLDLSNYPTKADLRNATGVDTSKFAEKVDLASLKLEIDKLDIDKLETTPVDLSELSHVVKKWSV